MKNAEQKIATPQCTNDNLRGRERERERKRREDTKNRVYCYELGQKATPS